jgi:ABC-2 type transport system ATP-binding protein
MSDALIVQNLRKLYVNRQTRQTKEALSSVDLRVPQGSIFALLGRNGAGKTTFINILAGIVTKTSGKVSIFGHDVDRQMRESRYQIGVVPQELVLDPFFTVRETLENHAGYYGVPKSMRRTDELLEALHLQEKADVKPGGLSGGMKRRLLIAKAMVHSPRLLVLDEPSSGVDLELRDQLWSYIRKLHQQGTTIILTTHYLAEAQELCDHVAIIDHGTIIACDTKEALLHDFAKKTLTIKLVEPLSKLPKSLATMGVVLTETGSIKLHYLPHQKAIGELLRAISLENLAIDDISVFEPSLEDVYRALVSTHETAMETEEA